MPRQVNQPLPAGHALQSYRIRALLSQGSFSMVYVAEDAGGLPVAIKEYLPATLALRADGSHCVAADTAESEAFRYGLRCFFEEGRALAGLSHPNIVRVLDFFRANDTAYMVMRYEHGRTLEEHIRRHRGALNEEFLRRTMAALLDGLREVHSNRLLHLDIKPANIFLRNDGTPVLIDFGGARQMLGQGTAALSPMYTPGFAAPEQYAERRQLGPWTDIYSVGATLYACLGGTAPVPAEQRGQSDALRSARKRWAGRYTPPLLQTIDWCLRLDPSRRPQSVFALQKVLRGERDPTTSLSARSSEFRDLVAKLARWAG